MEIQDYQGAGGLYSEDANPLQGIDVIDICVDNDEL